MQSSHRQLRSIRLPRPAPQVADARQRSAGEWQLTSLHQANVKRGAAHINRYYVRGINPPSDLPRRGWSSGWSRTDQVHRNPKRLPRPRTSSIELHHEEIARKAVSSKPLLELVQIRRRLGVYVGGEDSRRVRTHSPISGRISLESTTGTAGSSSLKIPERVSHEPSSCETKAMPPLPPGRRPPGRRRRPP